MARRKDAAGAGEVGPRAVRFALVTSIVVVTAILVLPCLVPRSVRDQPFLVDPSRVVLRKAPAWFDATARAAIGKAVARCEVACLRNDADVLALVESLGVTSGWIAEVGPVRKRYPDVLEVHVDLRRPVARVRDARTEYLIDAKGVVIAPSSQAPGLVQQERLPLLFLPAPPDRLAVGEVPEVPDLLRGVATAAEIWPHLAEFERAGAPVALIDLAPRTSRPEVRISAVDLITVEGLRIEWGTPASTPGLGKLEPPVPTKLAHLRAAARDHPGFEGLRTLRLQFPDHYSAERLVPREEVPESRVDPFFPAQPRVADAAGAP